MSDRWKSLRQWTQARIGLERHGHSVSTETLLAFQLAHARARDAVHRTWDPEALAKKWDESPHIVHTRAPSREIFLQRPDLGRQLSEEDFARLPKLCPKQADLVFCVSDGLSSAAVDAHLIPFWKQLSPELKSARFSCHPPILVPFGRVAAGDAVGEALKARIAVMLIGERPGLSAADSLGIYLTYAPRRGTSDSRRNCISNIRPPEGLGYAAAVKKLLFLLNESLRRQLSGVELKEEAGALPKK